MPRKGKSDEISVGHSLVAMQRRLAIIRQCIAAERDALALRDRVAQETAKSKRRARRVKNPAYAALKALIERTDKAMAARMDAMKTL